MNAETVIARVGGDLNIASVQDTSESSAHQQSMSGGLNLSQGGASGSFSYSRGNASANYAGVVEQSGIQAGAGGFDVDVAGNTDLKGAYIASTADASKNQLTTGTLTFSEIENHSDYSANSFGFGGGFSIANSGAEKKTTGPTSGKNKGGISPMLPQFESGSEHATTYSGVSEGTITLTDGANQKLDLASLKRDTTDLNGTVGRTPDLQELLNDQSRLMSAATAAGEAVARDIGTYASKKEDEARTLAKNTTDPELKAQYEKEAENWKEGGDYRALMHAAGGAIVAGLGGGNALGGALGAGATSKLGDALNKLSADIQNSRPTGNADVDEALAQIVATGIGTAVGGAVGGSSGAFTGFNTDRYNRQLSPDERAWAKRKASDFSRYYEEKTGQTITEEQAQNMLLANGYRLVDDMASKGPGGNVTAIHYISEHGGDLFSASAAERANPGSLGGALTPEQIAMPAHEAHPQVGMALAAGGALFALGAVAPVMAKAWALGSVYHYAGDVISGASGLSEDSPNVGKSLTAGGVAGVMSPLFLPLSTLGGSVAGKVIVGSYNTALAGTGAFGTTAVTSPGNSPDLSAGLGAAASLLAMGSRAILPGPIGHAFDVWIQTLPGPAQAAIEKNQKGK